MRITKEIRISYNARKAIAERSGDLPQLNVVVVERESHRLVDEVFPANEERVQIGQHLTPGVFGGLRTRPCVHRSP